MDLIKRVTGIIFVSGEEGVEINSLVDVLSEPVELIQETLNELNNLLFNSENSPIILDLYNNHYRFITKPELEDDLISFAQTPYMQKLSRSAIETLAIIAYRQPITRMGIDEIRGVSSQNMLQKLQSRQLIKNVGHVDAPGRPILYGTSDYFLSYFGLSNLKQLPPIEPLALNAELMTDNLFNTRNWIIEENLNNENEEL